MGVVTLRVITWNIHSGVGCDDKRNVGRIADRLMEFQPDIVFLQEVRRSRQHGDQAREIADRLKMTHVAAAGGSYAFRLGNAILSKLPLTDIHVIPLPNPLERWRKWMILERRTAITAIVTTPVGPISCACTHWSLAEGDRIRAGQILADWSIGTANPVIMAGDFNARPGAKSLQLLSATGLSDSGADSNYPTFPAESPQSRIDVIWTQGVIVEQCQAGTGTESDHLMVAGTLSVTQRH